jgi:hypothetical protein
MPRPRVSIGMLMMVVLVAALDLAMFRAIYQAFSDELYVFGMTAIPTLSILLVVFSQVVVQLKKRGETKPWHVGFLSGAFLGLLIMLAVLSLRTYCAPYLMWVNSLITSIETALNYQSLLGEAAFLLALNLPQLILAVTGAALTSRFGITLVARGKTYVVAPAVTLSVLEPAKV